MNAFLVKRGKQRCVLCFLFTVCCLLLTTPAHAHAQLVAATPANGETLTASPREIHLVFNENLGADNQVELLRQGFRRVEGVEIRETVFNEIFVTIPTLEAGVYTVQYDVVSADDHIIRGSYEFAVQPPPESNSLFAGVSAGVLVSLATVAFLIYRRTRLVAQLKAEQSPPPAESQPPAP